MAFTPGLDITTNIGCSVACPFCPQGTLIRAYQKVAPVKVMTFETFKACIDTVPTAVEMWFAGMAEPWLNKDATKMVLYAHERGHKIHVATTMKGMTLEDVKQLETIEYLSFRLHLPAIEGYEKIKIDDSYLAVLRALLSSKTIKLTDTKVHGKRAVPVVEALVKEYGRSIWVEHTHTRASNDVKVKDRPMRKRMNGPISCGADLKFNELVPSGDVYICCNDYNLDHPIGNLLTTSYAELFHSDGFKSVQDQIKHDKTEIFCRYCQYACYDQPHKRAIQTIQSHVRTIRESEKPAQATIGVVKHLARRLKEVTIPKKKKAA